MKEIKIGKIKTLLRILSADSNHVNQIIDNIEEYYVADEKKKKDGSPRILHKPKFPLKRLQNNIRKILITIPLSDSVHGWVKGRSITSALKPHLGKKYIYSFDINSYFDSIGNRKVFYLFRDRLKCSSEVAVILTKLTTYKHILPQGSPCSPAIANLILFDFDIEIESFIKKFRGNYTRIGDDIIISSDSELHSLNKTIIIGLRRRGLKLNKEKSQHGEPSKSGIKILGVVIASNISVRRKYRYELKAILKNAEKTGIENQNLEGRYNFRDYLRCRIEFVKMFNPDEGEKLIKQLSTIKN